MTKVYKIGNKEIVLEDRKSEKYWGAYNIAYARDIHDALVAVLEALDEKKEECKHDSGYTCGSCNTCGESKLVGGGGAGKPDNKCQHGSTYGSGGKYCSCKKEEPKSTLRDVLGLNIQEISDWGLNVTGGLLEADKIISLFKDTLLAEISSKKKSFATGEWTVKYDDIINLIKNI